MIDEPNLERTEDTSGHEDLGEPVRVGTSVWPVLLASRATSSQMARRRGRTASGAERCRLHGVTECGGKVRNRICEAHSTLVFQISLR